MNGCCYRAEMTSVTEGLAAGNYSSYGLGLISRHQPDSGGPYDHYYHFDGLGSTWALTDLSGGLQGRYSYDAWGTWDGRSPGGGIASDRFRYVGESGYYDDFNRARLVLLGARYYRADIGRFISADPIGYGGGDLNLYAYVGADPVNSVDPEGLKTATAPSAPAKPTPGPRGPMPRFPPEPGPVARACGWLSRCASTAGRGIVSGARAAGGFVGRHAAKGAAVASAWVIILTDCAPAGPTPRQLEDYCEWKWEDCRDRVRHLVVHKRITRQDAASFFYRECTICRGKCSEEAGHGNELPWPKGGRCDYDNWPKGHPAWPI